MNQKALLWILVALVVVLVGTTIYFAAQKYAYVPSVSQPTSTQTESLAGKIPGTANQQTAPTTQHQTSTISSLNPKIRSLDDKWNLYTNEQLGFSIKIPKQVDTGITEEEFRGNCPETEAVNVFEDRKYVYIASEYSYYGNAPNSERCKKTNLEILKTRWQTGEDQNYTPTSLLIVTGEAKNDQEIEKFIKDNIGSDCKGFEKKASTDFHQQGVLDLTIKSNSDGYCIMNFRYDFKYDPFSRKIVYTIIGHDCIFGESGTGNCLDGEIVKSLRYTQK